MERVAELGPWILGLAALAQVWAIGLWRWYRRGEVEIYESGVIEVGYGTFGATIGLVGTLQAVHKEVFVERLGLVVTRERDGATHEFSWRALRPRTISLSGTQDQELELPFSFLLKPTDPFRYNVFFVDDALLAELKPEVDPVARGWFEFRRDRLAELQSEDNAALKMLAEDSRTDEVLYKEYSKSEEVVKAYTTLDRGCYWTPGQYRLELLVECSSPKKVFTKKWRFELTEDDADELHRNSVSVLRSITGFQTFFSFAHAEYEDP